MGTNIQFNRPDGQTAPGYEVSAPGSPGIVVLQEWWGINEQIKALADRLATQGYQVVVPDLYRGTLTTQPAAAQQLMSNLNWNDAVTQDVQGAILHLKATTSKIAVMGFCMGGALTLMSAVKLQQLDAAICFYGIPPADAADPSHIKIPLQAHFANIDDWCTPTLVTELEHRLQQGGVHYSLFRYEAQHAFMNETRPEVYNIEAAKLAWDRSLAFLKEHLSS